MPPAHDGAAHDGVGPDAAFSDPRLAGVYDSLDPDRSDLDAYLAMIAEFAATHVLDVGCGTGTFAIRAAAGGAIVTGVDPARASLDVARRKPDADLVRWVDGDAPSLAARLPHLRCDLAVMTANVAQVFVTDQAWHATLCAVGQMLAPGGRLVFETRIPARRSWEHWDGPGADVDIPGVGRVSDHYEVLDVTESADGGAIVTFRSPTTFHLDGIVIDSVSTLRFRTLDTVRADLAACGFELDEVRDAPDRPDAEWVIVASLTKRARHVS